MPAVGHGVYEIRVHLENEYRVLYVAPILDCVVVLHAFIKKTEETPQRDIKAARQELQKVLKEISYGQINDER